jgi:hypothetical protein
VSNLAYTEVNGRPVIITGELQVVDAQTGAILADADDPQDPHDVRQYVAVRRDGRAAFFQTDSNSNHFMSRYALSYHNGQMAMVRTHEHVQSGDGRGLVMDTSDELLYTVANNAMVSQFPSVYASGFVYSSSFEQLRFRSMAQHSSRRSTSVSTTASVNSDRAVMPVA